MGFKLFFVFEFFPNSSAVFVLITYTDRTSLYCSSKHLIDAETMQLVGPTPFCTFSGLYKMLGADNEHPI